MADQTGRQTANLKGINKNHSIHYFLSTVLLQELAQVEYDCQCLLELTLKCDKFIYCLDLRNGRLTSKCGQKSQKINQN